MRSSLAKYSIIFLGIIFVFLLYVGFSNKSIQENEFYSMKQTIILEAIEKKDVNVCKKLPEKIQVEFTVGPRDSIHYKEFRNPNSDCLNDFKDAMQKSEKGND